jgi:hypothetical protein
VQPFIRRSGEIRKRLVRIIPARIEYGNFHGERIRQAKIGRRKFAGLSFPSGEAIEIASLAFRGPAGAGWSKPWWQKVRLATFPNLFGWREILHVLGDELRADSRWRFPQDADGPGALVRTRHDNVASLNFPRRLRRDSTDGDVASADGCRCLRPRLEYTHGPEPLIQPHL